MLFTGLLDEKGVPSKNYNFFKKGAVWIWFGIWYYYISAI